jgi:hypothetical protein
MKGPEIRNHDGNTTNTEEDVPRDKFNITGGSNTFNIG